MAWQKNFVIRPLLLGLILAAGTISSFASANVTLAWNASTNPIVAGFNIYYGGASGVYTNKTSVGLATSLTVSNLLNGSTYYFAATTYSAAGAESALSSEVSYTVPATVNPANQPPTLNPISNLTVNENAGAQTVNLSGITAGAGDQGQTLTVTAKSSNTAVIPNPSVTYTSPGATGSLGFTPVANASGSATLTVTVNDGGASNNLITRSFVVTVGLVTEQLRQTPGGQMVLTLSGPAGSNYVIQTSADLVHWTAFSTNAIPPGGSVEIVDLNPVSLRKFYRAAPYTVTGPATQQSNFILSNGVFSFTLSGSAGTYVIQSSTNLITWTSFSTNTIPPGGSVQVTDTNAASSEEIYRAVPLAGSVPPAPLLSGFKLGNGIFSFDLDGPPGSNYVIQTSTDLAHWTAFSTNTISPDGSVIIVDLNPAFPRKFYRAASYDSAAILPTSPQLAGSQLSRAGFSFVLNGQPGHNYEIQATQNFATWTVIGTATLGAGGSLQFTDTNAASFSKRFYRLHDTQP